MDYFGYGIDDWIPCEIDNKKCIDVHHIDGRGKGKNVIENLIGVCRECHVKCHESKEFNEKAREIHLKNL